MNLQLANVLSDVSGVTGQAIVKAILAGERNPWKLAEFRDKRVKASEEEIARSLEGNWQEDLLFLLKQEQDGYEFCQGRWRNVTNGCSSISNRGRIAVPGPVCPKRSERNGSGRKKRTSLGSICEQSYFV